MFQVPICQGAGNSSLPGECETVAERGNSMPTVSSNLVKVAANITVISFVLLLVAVQAASSDLKVSQLNSLIKDGQGVYGSVTYIWRVADRNYTSAIIPQDFHETSRRIGDETRAELSRRGISDKSYIASAVSSNVEQEREIDKDHITELNASVSVARSGDKCLITSRFTGSNTNPEQNWRGTLVSYFQGSLGIFSPSAESLQVEPQNEWSPVGLGGAEWYAPGPAVFYNSPIPPQIIRFPPELLAVVGCNNATGLYGAVWHTTIVDPSEYRISAVLDAIPNQRQCIIEVTLDRRRNNLPLDVLVTPLYKRPGSTWHESIHVNSFVKKDDTFVPSSVSFYDDEGSLGGDRQEWTLAETRKSADVGIELPNTAIMTDYRLLGTRLTSADLGRISATDDSRLVVYPWQGRVLSDRELESMRLLDNPAVNRSRGAVILMAVLGALLVVTGIAAYRARRRLG